MDDQRLGGVTDCDAQDIVKVRKMYAMQAKKFRKTGKKNEADTHIPDLKVRGVDDCRDVAYSVFLDSRSTCSPGSAASKRTGDNTEWALVFGGTSGYLGMPTLDHAWRIAKICHITIFFNHHQTICR